MAIRTIFSMAEDCARGDRLGWQEFVRDFAGIGRALLTHYFPTLVPDMDEHVIAVFRRAGTRATQPASGGRAGDPSGATWCFPTDAKRSECRRPMSLSIRSARS